MSSLVVVESPAKAKTLARILGGGYSVEASYGHVRDLPASADAIPNKFKGEPWARLGVNVQQEFEPLYVIPNDKKKYIKRLKDALADADELLLATDEDREGESISWHVVEVLKPKVPVRRIAFHEITKEAILAALENPRDIDSNLVRAQESRRILDRLFGYELSPVLWKKVQRGLSAGRVQSVAVRLCVERERERRRFKSGCYWDVEAQFVKQQQAFTARLVRVGDGRLATGKDFDPETGELKKRSQARWLRDGQEIEDLMAAWQSPWSVTSVEDKPQVRRPAPPFTTSSLQQEANRKLRFSARHTMRIAQKLYEGMDYNGDRIGLITYMRTDSVTLAGRALQEAQEVIRDKYGEAYAKGPRRYATKTKGAQEAHEAIRPTKLSRTPDRLKSYLSHDELRLYDLIWKRTVASQMAEARLRRTAVEITAPAEDPASQGIFSATGTTIEFPGFLRAYVEGSDDPSADLADKEVILPNLETGEECAPEQLEPKRRETMPPARYSEASLVKKLEAEGIGRPSTYASILDTIQQRGYVLKQNNALVPTLTAFAVTELLENHFADLVDTSFTARMEQQLDDIAAGTLDWKDHLNSFYYGEGDGGAGLEEQIKEEEPKIDFPAIEIGKHPESGEAIVIRVGRYGPYLQVEDSEGEKIHASVPDDVAPADLTVDEAVRMLEKAKQGAQLLGHDPESHENVYLAHGRYGAYVQLGETPKRGSKEPKPKRASLPKSVAEEEVTLEKALLWLSLPRVLGVDPENDEEVIAASGRFGPFVKRGKDTRSLAAEDDVYTVEMPRALELLAQPKGRRGRRPAQRTVLKDFGAFDGGGNVQLVDGHYGPYLTNGDLNASLPKGTDASALTAEAASTLLRERGKPPKRRQKRSSK
ncbi:MAG: type I DNA topoisomerase [Thermoanaerobaculia bacterium]